MTFLDAPIALCTLKLTFKRIYTNKLLNVEAKCMLPLMFEKTDEGRALVIISDGLRIISPSSLRINVNWAPNSYSRESFFIFSSVVLSKFL